MASDKKVISNRKNAKASSGPRTSDGKRRSSRNAVRHGLAVSIESDPAWRDSVEVLAGILCVTKDDQRDQEACREAARAAVELIRMRHLRRNSLRNYVNGDNFDPALNTMLEKLDRYE